MQINRFYRLNRDSVCYLLVKITWFA